MSFYYFETSSVVCPSSARLLALCLILATSLALIPAILFSSACDSSSSLGLGGRSLLASLPSGQIRPRRSSTAPTSASRADSSNSYSVLIASFPSLGGILRSRSDKKEEKRNSYLSVTSTKPASTYIVIYGQCLFGQLHLQVRFFSLSFFPFQAPS